MKKYVNLSDEDSSSSAYAKKYFGLSYTISKYRLINTDNRDDINIDRNILQGSSMGIKF